MTERHSPLRSWARRSLKVTAHPYEGIPVLLASGVGRSGTTVLRKSLSAHPQVHSTETENNIVYDVLDTARHNCTYPSRRATMHVAPPAYDRQFRMLLLNLLWPEPQRGRKRPGALLASTDLTPDRADYAQRVFPAHHIAYIVRNGIAVVASRMTHPNFSGAPFEEHCGVWAASADMARWGASLPTFTLIRQESLLSRDTAHEALATLWTAMGLPFDDACLAPIGADVIHPTAYAGESQDDTANLGKRSERWKLWDDAQRDAFARICGAAMNDLGYAIPWTG